MTESTLRVLNALLAAHPGGLSGSDIINSLNMFSGTLYPLLHRLEKECWVDASWEDIDPQAAARPRRRYYALTEYGLVEARSSLLKHRNHVGFRGAPIASSLKAGI